MQWPCFTLAGHSYDYYAISKWLETRSTDPLTGVQLADKSLRPNYQLRSVITSWFDEHPAVPFPVKILPPPPPYRDDLGGRGSQLDKVMVYKGKSTLPSSDTGKTSTNGKPPATLPSPVTAHGYTYTFQLSATGELQVSCDNGVNWITATNKAMFVSPLGIVFYDPGPEGIRQARELPGAGGESLCKRGNQCSNASCTLPHPFVCGFGVNCRKLVKGSCKFYHPTKDSVTLAPQATNQLPGAGTETLCRFTTGCTRSNCKFAHPFDCKHGGECPEIGSCKFRHGSMAQVPVVVRISKDCKYGTSCSNKGCTFPHPNGRLSKPLETAKVLVTHTLDLKPWPTDVNVILPMEFPIEAREFHFQGDFVFFFVPYSETWGKKHSKAVIVHRYNKEAEVYELLGQYSLDGHYCNCAVAEGRYMVFSFWPYDEEALRAIWGYLRIQRKLQKRLEKMERELQLGQKEMKALSDNLAMKDADIAELKGRLQEKEANITLLQNQITLLQQKITLLENQNEVQRQKIISLEGVIEETSGKLEAEYKAKALLQKQIEDLRSQELKAVQINAALQAASQTQQQTIQQQQQTIQQQAAAQAQQRYAAEAELRRMQQNMEASYQERLRQRDPIHIYAMTAETTGAKQDDWVLVIDYHKGAHDLKLGPVQAGGSQTLEVVERENVFTFEMVVPANPRALGQLPIVPSRLCADF